MQKRKIMCMAVSVLTAVSMLAPSVGYSKVKKPALSKKKLTLKVGESKTLKVKNNKKKVKWSSSKKSVATVSSKGKVKAKKVGKATITAKIAKKKLTCKVTVKAKSKSTDSSKNTNKNTNNSTNNSTNNNNSSNNAGAKKEGISSVSVLNSTTIELVLEQAQQLPLNAFSVMGKRYSQGQYNYQYEIENISTSDNKVYRISIGPDQSIYSGYTIKVTVSGLTGTSGQVSKEAIYTGISTNDYTSEGTYVCQLGEKIDRYYYLSEGDGYVKVDSVQVPEGITYKVKQGSDHDESYISFSGEPTKTGVFNNKILYTDELGHQYTHTIHWLIGSQDTIVANMQDSYVMYTKNKEYVSYSGVSVIGGSGEYTFEITKDSAEGAYIAEDYYSDGSGADTYIGFRNKTQGDKLVYVKVTDVKDSSKSIVVKWNIHVKNTISVAGSLMDASGQPIQKNAEIQFRNVDDNNKYIYNTYNTYNPSDNCYKVDIVEGTYDVYLVLDEERIKLASNYMVNKDENKDFVLKGYYPVEISCTEDISNATWYDEDNCDIGTGNLLYLTTGAYELTSTANNNMEMILTKVSFMVNNAKVNAQAVVSERSNMLKGDIVVDEPISLSLNYVNRQIYDYYKFVPEESGWYSFYSESDYDTYGSLLNENYEQIDSDDDGGDDGDFKIQYECQAGKTYYIGIRSYGQSYAGKSATLSAIAIDNPEDVE